MDASNGVSIDITALGKSFNGTPVLRGIDLHIDAGEIMISARY